jgi:hypothetical protein
MEEIPGERIKITIYPNPFHDQLMITADDLPDGVYHLLITDLAGREIWQNSVRLRSGENSLMSGEGDATDILNFRPGIYFINVRSADGILVYSGKVIKY